MGSREGIAELDLEWVTQGLPVLILGIQHWTENQCPAFWAGQRITTGIFLGTLLDILRLPASVLRSVSHGSGPRSPTESCGNS